MFAIDTCVVLWAIRGVPDKAGRPMGERAKALLKSCEQAEIPLLFPLPVVVEVLCGLEESRHPEFLATLARIGLFGALDEDGALIAGRLERRSQAERRRSGFDEPRQAIKVDVLIAAIAIRYGATKFYTNNVRDFEKITTGERLEVCELPELPQLPVVGTP